MNAIRSKNINPNVTVVVAEACPDDWRSIVTVTHEVSYQVRNSQKDHENMPISPRGKPLAF